MNTDLTNRIVEYLELDTNYAIIINGGYGIGKTHYIKNQLFPLVKDKYIPKSTTEKFNPIPISLFGVNSIEDIQNQILLELYPILKNKGLKVATGLAKSLIKNLAGVDISTIFSDTEISSTDLFDYSKVLLCIDDIDRKSKELQLPEVFGYINNLVENYNAKVILIANEDELRKEINTETERDNYSILKEKVIGITVNFKSNVSGIYDEIIEEKYKVLYETYYTFLSENKALIVQKVELNSGNLRNLLFFLEHFKIIYKNLHDYIFVEEKYREIKTDIIKNILDFALPIAIEYKMGKLNSGNFENIKNLYVGSSFDFMRFIGKKEAVETPKTYIDEYKEKYTSSNHEKLMFFDSVFKYITGTSSINIDELSNEISSIYKFEDNTIPEREKTLTKLNYWDCIDLTISDYRFQTNKLLESVDKGEFSLDQYPTIFHYVTRFDNILNYNINNLKKRFRKGIKCGQTKYKYVNNLHFRISIDNSTEFYADVKEIVDYCIEINNGIQKVIEEKKVNDVFEMFSQNFDEFLEKIQEPNNDFLFTPYLSTFNFNKTWRIINKLSNLQTINLAFYFSYRYRVNIYERLFPEKEFLIALKEKITEKYEKKGTTKMEKIALAFLNKKINESINNFP